MGTEGNQCDCAVLAEEIEAEDRRIRLLRHPVADQGNGTAGSLSIQQTF